MSELSMPPEIYLPSHDGVVSFADGRVEVLIDEERIIVDGISKELTGHAHELATLLASWPDHTIPMIDICLNERQEYNDKAISSAKMDVRKLRHVLGPDLGSTVGGAILARPGMGYSALGTLGVATQLPRNGGPVHSFADERIDVQPRTWLVRCDDILFRKTTRAEFEVLHALAKQPGQAVEHEAFEETFGTHWTQDVRSTLKQHIYNLRSRLPAELGDASSGAIRLKRNVGYWVPRSLSDAQPDLSTGD